MLVKYLQPLRKSTTEITYIIYCDRCDFERRGPLLNDIDAYLKSIDLELKDKEMGIELIRGKHLCTDCIEDLDNWIAGKEL